MSSHVQGREIIPICYQSSLLSLILVIAILLSGLSCEQPPEEASQRAVTQARSMFEEVIRDFDKKKETVDAEIKRGSDALITFKDAIREAKDRDAEFAKVYNKWESVQLEVKGLHSVFENMVRSADGFYTELTNRANTIVDRDLRDDSIRKIRDSRDNYVVRLKTSKSKIDQLDLLADKVRDTMTFLEIHFTLDVVERRLDETFTEIDRMVKAIMKDLDALLTESRALTKRHFGGA